MNRSKFVGLACVTLVIAGCGESFPSLKPVRGTISQPGKTVTAGGLIFSPEGKRTGLIVNANVQSDGSFVLESSLTDDYKTEIRPGAPMGRYRVTYHPPSNGAVAGLEYNFPDVITIDDKTTSLTFQLPAELPKGSGVARDDDPNSPKFDPNRKE